MKQLLTKKFDLVHWAGTYELRQSDLARQLPTITLQAQWKWLFSYEGVILFSMVIYTL